jgi:hypothetical protein
MLISAETKDPQKTLWELVHSEYPFDSWLKGQLETLLGWKIQNMLSDPPYDLIFDWHQAK